MLISKHAKQLKHFIAFMCISIAPQATPCILLYHASQVIGAKRFLLKRTTQSLGSNPKWSSYFYKNHGKRLTHMYCYIYLFFYCCHLAALPLPFQEIKARAKWQMVRLHFAVQTNFVHNAISITAREITLLAAHVTRSMHYIICITLFYTACVTVPSRTQQYGDHGCRNNIAKIILRSLYKEQPKLPKLMQDYDELW